MAQSFLPTTAEDANRQQLVSAFFWTVGDILSGSDTVMRTDPGNLRRDGLLGPAGSNSSYGVGNGGELYIRGSAGQQAGTGQTEAPTAAAGLALSPAMIAVGLLLVFLLKR